MKRWITALLVGIFAVSAFAAEAELKVGFVNGQRVINESPQAAKAKKKLEKEFEKRDQELQKLAKQLQTVQEALEKNQSTAGTPLSISDSEVQFFPLSLVKYNVRHHARRVGTTKQGT